MVSMTLLSSTVVVSSVAAGEMGTDAMVEGTNTSPTQGAIGAEATPILAPRVLLMFPPVGMEAQVVADVVRGSLLFGVGVATFLIPAGTPNAPTAGRD